MSHEQHHSSLTQFSQFVPGLVSTIMPVYNRTLFLEAAIKSVLAQTYHSIELIIIDDGSTDETTLVSQKLAENHPEIIRYFRQENTGPGPAREMGRQKARGEFIQYLDSDDLLLPNKFTDQIKVLRSFPECDIAYGIDRLIDEEGKVLSEPYKWTDKHHDSLFPVLLQSRWWPTHAPLYRKSFTDRIGSWSSLKWGQDLEYDARSGGLSPKLVQCGTLVSETREHRGLRQTTQANWDTDPIRLKNRYELMVVIWNNALKAKVSPGIPECHFFSRKCFAFARLSAAAGLIDESNHLIKMAIESSGGVKSALRGIRTFKLLSQILGEQLAGKLLESSLTNCLKKSWWTSLLKANPNLDSSQKIPQATA